MTGAIEQHPRECAAWRGERYGPERKSGLRWRVDACAGPGMCRRPPDDGRQKFGKTTLMRSLLRKRFACPAFQHGWPEGWPGCRSVKQPAL